MSKSQLRAHSSTRPRGIARADVIVSIGAVSILALLLGAGLSGAGIAEMAAKCRGNLKNIGVALNQSALEDPREQAIPLHAQWFAPNRPSAITNFVMPWMWGGVSGTEQWRVTPTMNVTLTESDPLGAPYSGSTRPLSQYVSQSPIGSGPIASNIFACPADIGYPPRSVWADYINFPVLARQRPLIGLLGNSYRNSQLGYPLTQSRMLSAAPLGHRLSSLIQPDRQAWVFDSLFQAFVDYAIDGYEDTPDPVPVISGWHGTLRADNVLFVDGSARFTLADPVSIDPFGNEPPEENIDGFAYFNFMRRGPSYKLDCYPTPGAAIAPINSFGWVNTAFGDDTLWPVANHQQVWPGQ